ncbi:MAG: helix-turn-helix domain-containing protein [Cyclobacteriaceae bacterium]|nr:helix-turn-helix domain-containing protein [Cyclobacteriaceae bacterium]
MNVIFTIGIFISLFQFVLLLNKKSKSLSDKVLAVWMLIIGIHLTNYYIYYLGYWDIYPHLVGLTVPFPLLYGPVLYLYILYSLKSDNHIRKIDYLHFAPAILSYLYMFQFYFFYSVEEKRLVDKGEINDFDIFSNLLLLAFVVSGISYSLFSYQLLKKHKNIIENNFSNTEHINLNWLKGFILGVGLIFLTVIITIILKDIVGINYSMNPDYIYYSMLVFAILTLGYFGIRHQNIFIDNIVIVSEIKTKGEYRNSGLKEEDAIEKYNSLLQLMNEEKPYLDPKLTLYSLADLLEISPNHLSQIINQYEQQNFNDFINKYRIEEFLKNALENKNYSFLALALDSGFNSKSTFNTVFKKQKGVTPSHFISLQK